MAVRGVLYVAAAAEPSQSSPETSCPMKPPRKTVRTSRWASATFMFSICVPGALSSQPSPGYPAAAMTEYTALRSARSRGSPVSTVPIPLVTYP